MIKFWGENNHSSDSGEMMIFCFWCPRRSNHLHLHSVFLVCVGSSYESFFETRRWLAAKVIHVSSLDAAEAEANPSILPKEKNNKGLRSINKTDGSETDKRTEFFSMGGFNRSPFMLNYICELINTTFDCCWILSECSDAKARRRSGWKLHSLNEI